MSIVSYILEEVLLAFTALSSVHTLRGFDLLQLRAVAGIAVLRAVAGVTAVTGLTGLTRLVAFTAGALTAVTGIHANNSSGVCTVAGGVTAVGGVLHQRQVVWMTCDLCAAVVLCA